MVKLIAFLTFILKILNTAYWAVFFMLSLDKIKNIIMKKVFSLLMLALFAVAISSCEEKKPSEKIEDGVEEVGEGIEDAADDVEDEM